MDIVIYTIFVGIGLVGIGVLAYVYIIKEKLDYRKARQEIFVYVKSYETRAGGSNRFEVTVEILQDVFREYDTVIINKIWLDLIDEKVIEKDPYDNAWCIR